MILSMTGYGKADAHFGNHKIHVEVKSLNSKNLDLNLRVASLYREREMEIRRYVAAELQRGKIDFTLWVERDEVSAAAPLNAAAIADYVKQIRAVSKACDIPEPNESIWNTLIHLPDTMVANNVEELSDEEWDVVRLVTKEAVARLVDFRRQEGEALTRKFNENVDRIEKLLHSIEPFEQSRVERIRRSLEDRLSELKGVDYDKNRLEQELIYYIEKLDINEEKQRLANHLDYFRRTLAAEPGQGKKLGFIAQEMGREINTTGSKSNLAEMQNIVVKMKDELEQIKEQVLNVL